MIWRSGIHRNAVEADIIHEGMWSLPDQTSNNYLHSRNSFSNWATSFDLNRSINLHRNDASLWTDIPGNRVKTVHIWASIRSHGTKVICYEFAWHKSIIARYIFFIWTLCLKRLYVGSVECQNHLMVQCSYSRFILNRLLLMLPVKY